MKIVEHCVKFQIFTCVCPLKRRFDSISFFLSLFRIVSFSHVQKYNYYYYYYKQMPGIVASLKHQQPIFICIERKKSEHEHACNILQLFSLSLTLRRLVYVTMNGHTFLLYMFINITIIFMTPNYFATILISFHVRILLFMRDVNSTYKSIFIHTRTLEFVCTHAPTNKSIILCILCV